MSNDFHHRHHHHHHRVACRELSYGGDDGTVGRAWQEGMRGIHHRDEVVVEEDNSEIEDVHSDRYSETSIVRRVNIIAGMSYPYGG